jgi:hypothetical protein
MWRVMHGNGASEAWLGNVSGLRMAVGLQGGLAVGGGRVKRLLLIILFYHQSIVVCIFYLGPHQSHTLAPPLLRMQTF